MGKKEDIDDLLGTPGDKAPAKKAPAKKAKPEVTEAAPAKKAAKKEAKPDAEDPLAAKAAPAKKAAAKEPDAPKAKKARPSVTFAEGERQGLYDKVLGHFKKSKKAINIKDLSTKLGVETRKLRVVLYALAKRESPAISLSLEGSRVNGMTVSPT